MVQRCTNKIDRRIYARVPTLGDPIDLMPGRE
jgi:hypothetical protein